MSGPSGQGATIIMGSLARAADERLPVWTRAFIIRIVDHFPPHDVGGLPPRIRIVDTADTSRGDHP